MITRKRIQNTAGVFVPVLKCPKQLNSKKERSTLAYVTQRSNCSTSGHTNERNIFNKSQKCHFTWPVRSTDLVILKGIETAMSLRSGNSVFTCCRRLNFSLINLIFCVFWDVFLSVLHFWTVKIEEIRFLWTQGAQRKLKRYRRQRLVLIKDSLVHCSWKRANLFVAV